MPLQRQVWHRSGVALAGLFGLALLTGTAAPAGAQMIIVGNDEKVILDDSGKQTYHPPGKDTVELLSLAGNPAEPKSIATIPLMNSLLGPPTNLAHRIHRSRLGWFDLQLGRADPLRLFHRGEV
jgi:hypothetical protein